MRDTFIVLFLVAHVVLAASCLWRNAQSWGWQMFANATIYRIEIRGRDHAGTAFAVDGDTLSEHLSPRALAYFRPTTEPRNFHRGRGLLIEAAAQMPAFLCRAIGRGQGAFSVRLEHRNISEVTTRDSQFEARCVD